MNKKLLEELVRGYMDNVSGDCGHCTFLDRETGYCKAGVLIGNEDYSECGVEDDNDYIGNVVDCAEKLLTEEDNKHESW